uniref:Uncharacterized protein n=1 Tax=Anguilla anguilla TaxID=7936 RepID=A0A0E9UTB6_ANGAN
MYRLIRVLDTKVETRHTSLPECRLPMAYGCLTVARNCQCQNATGREQRLFYC